MTERRALLILVAGEPAVFSEQSRTEGEHRTLAHPPGAALLGWAARDYDYWLGRGRAEAVFHSGKVRFSDALPLSGDDAPAYPIPQLLMEPKHRSSRDDRLGEDVRVGRAPDDNGEIQYEALKPAFVTRAGCLVKPDRGGRLRTATRGGRAERGKLFGFQHLEPESRRWAATIEANDGVFEDDEWRRLLALFDGRTLHIGRGGNTAYGGGYNCVVRDNGGGDLWPVGSVADGAERVRVWALSDLALVDNWGAPAMAPSAEALGLGAGWRLRVQDSVVSLRRYAPWNRALRGRDVERQAVAAGSVFTFERVDNVAQTKPCGLVGFAREAGLGRVWIAPPLLEVPSGAHWGVSAESVIFAPEKASSPPIAGTAAPGWLAALRKLNSPEIKGAKS